jgi:hypothetical protein
MLALGSRTATVVPAQHSRSISSKLHRFIIAVGLPSDGCSWQGLSSDVGKDPISLHGTCVELKDASETENNHQYHLRSHEQRDTGGKRCRAQVTLLHVPVTPCNTDAHCCLGGVFCARVNPKKTEKRICVLQLMVLAIW